MYVVEMRTASVPGPELTCEVLLRTSEAIE